MALPKNRPGGGLPPEERKEAFDRILTDFGISLANSLGFPDLSPQDAFICSLVAAHHWHPSQARSVAGREILLCLPAEWRTFFQSLPVEEREFLEAWPEEHGFPVPSPPDRQQ